MRYLFIICFLIVSCDLPGEANQDCFGVEDGFAEIDDCGVCAGGETGIELNADKDECGICNGPGSVYECGCSVCAQCGDESAINYNEEAINDDLCIYDLCTDYYTTNNSFECASNGSVPYTVGEDLTCETLETEFSMCYPECDNLIKLADFEDKIIFVIYEEDWWTSCYASIPQLEDDIILHYIDHPDIAIINVLNDGPGGLSCDLWGNQGNDKVPIIINDYEFNQIFGGWFGVTWSSPWYIVIDHNFKYQGKTQSEADAEVLLEQMITNMER